MPTFGTRSMTHLSSCVPEIAEVFNEAINFIDFSVTCGHRTPTEQEELYAIGRTKPGRIVTHKRGGESVHNTFPSLAADFAPYPIDWSDVVRFGVVAGVIKYIAWKKGIEMVWGGDWPRFKDYPHIQVSPNAG